MSAEIAVPILMKGIFRSRDDELISFKLLLLGSKDLVVLGRDKSNLAYTLEIAQRRIFVDGFK